MRKLFPGLVGLALIAALWQLPVWDQGVEHVGPDEAPRMLQRSAPSPELPVGHPPIEDDGSPAFPPPGDRPAARGRAPIDPGSLPLAPSGLGGQAELDRALAKLPEGELRARFDEAYRLTFTTRRDARDYGRAKATLQQISEAIPDLAEAYRARAYCEFNLTMSFPRSISLYERAVELNPDYGEAHYALAFMLGPNDPGRGAVHFSRAMALGIADERNLRERFYQGAN